MACFGVNAVHFAQVFNQRIRLVLRYCAHVPDGDIPDGTEGRAYYRPRLCVLRHE